jgi:lysophospholipase L1-like esterase
MTRNIWRAVAGLAVLLLLIEVGLRVFFGLGSPALVYANSKYGYAFQPNQSHKRFGHRIAYNEAGLRSESLRPLTGAAYRVLCIGGSITNGGAPIDQKDTYPYQLERILKEKGEDTQVLNGSAVGWSLPNEYGFLQDKGIFGARVVVLEVGTTSLYQDPDVASTAGTDPNLPEHKPATAIGELLDRYLLPRILRRLGSQSFQPAVWSQASMTDENYRRGLRELKDLISLVTQSGAKPIVVLTPAKDEAVPGHYRAEYRSDVSDLTASANGRFVDLMPLWHAELAEGKEPFRDLVDPNSEGNRSMAEAVAAAIRQ